MVNHICEPISSNQFASCSSARVGQGGGGAPLTILRAHCSSPRRKSSATAKRTNPTSWQDGQTADCRTWREHFATKFSVTIIGRAAQVFLDAMFSGGAR